MRNIVEEACPIEPTKVHQGTGKKVLVAESIEYIDADRIQAAAEEALGRVV
ncbi:hypothetical protein [Methanorbis furvi]|uniref:Uncharacterized protein n=1 Tax=Methanorbis furvi TaxID=3028299 RepID=A0AAE4ME37_9EURY|nr:hypothetical protein [Methanocorpusculaceae archaeon Ag1]